MSTSISATEIGLPDNAKLKLGTGEDLELYHDGSNSYLKDAGTGDLLVQGTQIKLQDASGNDYLRGFTGGAVYLHHAGNSKFETTSDGAKVTGELDVFETSGDILHVQGNSTNTVVAKIENAYTTDNDRFAVLEIKSGKGQLRFNSNGDSIEGAITYEMANNAMIFGVNNASERMRIDSSGNLVIKGAATSDNARMEIRVNDTQNEFRGSSNSGTNKAFAFYASNTNNSEIATFDSDGLKFGTDTATANALDDYEEGTFSPAWFDDGGVFVSSYGTQYGKYTKIGNTVFFTFGLRINTFSRTPNSSQKCRVGNLPFVSDPVPDDTETVFSLQARLWGAGNDIPLKARLRESSGGSGSNHVEFLMANASDGNEHELVGADFSTSDTCRVLVSGTYFTPS